MNVFPQRVPYIPQMEAVECGAASLAMILAYHGHCAPLVEVRQACAVGRDGVNAKSLLRAARSYLLIWLIRQIRDSDSWRAILSPTTSESRIKLITRISPIMRDYLIIDAASKVYPCNQSNPSNR